MKSFPEGATIYISGPITGLPDLNRDAFETAENFLRLWGFEPINPLKIHPPERTEYGDFMKEDLRAVLGAQGIYMLKGWQQSRGASVELDVAVVIGLPFEFEV